MIIKTKDRPKEDAEILKLCLVIVIQLVSPCDIVIWVWRQSECWFWVFIFLALFFFFNWWIQLFPTSHSAPTRVNLISIHWFVRLWWIVHCTWPVKLKPYYFVVRMEFNGCNSALSEFILKQNWWVYLFLGCCWLDGISKKKKNHNRFHVYSFVVTLIILVSIHLFK